MHSGVLLLKEIRRTCSRSEQKIVDYILAFPRMAAVSSISELAINAGGSSSAAIRLCKRAGLSSYRELQYLLALDMYSKSKMDTASPDLALSDNLAAEDIALLLADTSKTMIDRALSLLKGSVIEHVAQLVLKARTVFIFGCGESATAGYDCFHKLTCIGVHCYFTPDPVIQHSIPCGLSSADLVVVFGNSNWSRHNQSTVSAVKKTGATVVAIAGLEGNQLQKSVDFVLALPETRVSSGNDTSLMRNCQLFLVDVLYTTVLSRSLSP